MGVKISQLPGLTAAAAAAGDLTVVVDVSGDQTSAMTLADLAAFVAANSSYRYDQGVASATWTITHNLGRNVSVTTFEDFGSGGVQEIEGLVTNVSVNQVTIQFNAAISGYALYK